jgi:AraC-like DNA-binding protein/mannose-6-phosphate isomerase-like protein (cupin superfamily)
MSVLHRYDSEERQHYLFQPQYSLKIKPKLLYAGKLEKSDKWRENEHRHDFCEVIYVSDGRGLVRVGELQLPMKKGDVLIYNAGVPHEEESDPDSPMELYFMALGGLKITDLPDNHLLPPGLDLLYPSGDMAPVFANCFHNMIGEFEQKNPFFAEVTQNLALIMVMHIFRLINESTDVHTHLLQRNRSVEQAVNFINSNLNQDLTLELVAQQCHMSKYHLSHLFTQHQGTSIGKYILRCRMLEASRLLRETDWGVKDIAPSVGFQDISYFCRTFKREVGITPLQYRKRK